MLKGWRAKRGPEMGPSQKVLGPPMVEEVAMDNMDRADGVVESEGEDPLLDHHVMVIAEAVGLQREQGQGEGKPIYP